MYLLHLKDKRYFTERIIQIDCMCMVQAYISRNNLSNNDCYITHKENGEHKNVSKMFVFNN